MLSRRILYTLLILSMLLANLGVVPTAAHPTSASQEQSAAVPPAQALTVQLAPELDPRAFAASDAFELVFSEAMDPASADPALMTYPYLPGELTWNDARTRLSFRPTGGFEVRAYTLFLERDLKSARGQSFEKTQQWQIQVVPGPRVVSHEPAEVEILNLKPDIRITFDHEMDLESVKTSLVVEPPLQYGLQMKGTVLTLKLEGALAPGTEYRFTLGEEAQDAKKRPLEEAYTWTYHPAPLDVQSGLVKGKEIHLYFNYPIRTPDTGTPFSIEPALEGGWTWDKDGAVFLSELPVDRGQRYTITTTGPIYGMAGNSLGTPDPLVFVPDPPIAKVAPVGDWIDTTQKDIAITFEIPVDKTSAEKAFHIEPALKGHFDWVGQQLFYMLEERLAISTTYTVTLAPEVLDEQGRPVMLEPYSWFFESASYHYDGSGGEVSFGCDGPNIQVVDVNGQRSILFSTGISQSPVEFSLYPVELYQFVQLYRQYYQYRGYYAQFEPEDAIPTQDLKRLAYWQVEPTEEIQAVVLPVDAPPGLYVLSAAQDGELKDQLMVALTENTLVVKRTGTRLWIWASDINGESLPDTEVRLYTQDGQQMREGKTDAEGVFETSLPKDSPPMLAVARSEGGDVAISGFDGQWQAYMEGSWGWNSQTFERNDYQSYVYTDRPIYRPGHTVHFKVIVRQDDDARYTVPKNDLPVKVRILDPRDNELQTYELRINEFGSASADFQIGELGGLGEYRIEVSPGRSGEVGKFKVEDYRKPDYQVTVTSDQDIYYEGNPITMDIDTRYYFGEPVPNARLSVRKYALESWGWWVEPEETGTDAHYTWFAVGDASSYMTDAQGHFRYKGTVDVMGTDSYQTGCVTSWSSSLRRCTWALEVTAEDGSGQVVSGSRIYHVFNSTEKIVLDSGGWLKKPGETFRVQVSVTTLEGEKPVPDRKLVLEVLSWQDWNKTSQASYELMTGPDGMAQLDLQVDRTGSYELQVRPAGDSLGSVIARDWLYAYSARDNWVKDAWGSFRITAEESSYKPYQKARLAIESDFSGPAMLTFERGQVIHSLPVMLTAPLTIVETDIIPEYAPNVYVVVNAWRPVEVNFNALDDTYFWGSQSNSSLKLAQVELQVEAAEKALTVNITPGQNSYAPREEAVFDILITDAQNKPVEAEFSLALIDEAIFALSDDLSKPIFQAFYGRREHEVITYDSMKVARTLGICGDGRGGGGGGGSLGSPRGNFPDTAAWFPALVTGADGKAQVKVTLPDNLTTWRVVVKAITRGTKVGEEIGKIVTQQEVVLQPLLPRTLTTGDTMELSALLHNYSGQVRDFSVSLEAEGLEVQEGNDQKVTLDADEVRVVSWQVNAVKAGATEVLIRAEPAGGQGDAIRLPLEVRPLAIPEVYTQVGDFEGSTGLILSIPDQVLEMSEVEIRVSRSVAGNLLDGLAYLTGYPYGCVEQTMSRALPNAVVGRAFKSLGVENPQQDNLDEMVADGLQRLYGMQHQDGGWGWWHDDDSTPYQTAWVLYGLALTSEAGYPVDSGVLERGAQYLKAALAGGEEKEELDPRLKAYVLFSLATADQGDLEATLALAEDAEALDPFSQASLALALRDLGETQAARRILSELEASAEHGSGTAWWETGHYDGEYRAKTMASATRSTAQALEAFVKIAPTHDLIPDIVRYLMSQRKAMGWGTTNETTYTVLALTDHLLSLKETASEVTYQVALNGKTISEGSLNQELPLVSMVVPASELEVGLNDLKIMQEGDGRLFYTVTSRIYLDEPRVEAAGPVVVERAYLDPETDQPVKTFQPGQVVRVKLKVKFPVSYASYIIIEDSLPGGLEAINERLNTSSHYGGNSYDEYAETYYRFFWQEYGYNQKEIHGDRVSFFVTEINRWGNQTAGVIELDYLARVVHAGSFEAMPAQVYAMYDDTIWGRSASMALEVTRE